MKKLNLQLDFICELGNTSRLVKFFKERNILLRQISHDLARARIAFNLVEEHESALLNNVNGVLALVDSTRNIWKTCCIEVWVEENRDVGFKESAINKVNDVCIYVRPGKRNLLIRKLAWLDQCSWRPGIPIPESITRKCIDENSDASNIKKRIADFIKATAEDKEVKTR